MFLTLSFQKFEILFETKKSMMKKSFDDFFLLLLLCIYVAVAFIEMNDQ